MKWKKLLKRQTNFMEFGMTPPKGTMQRVSGDEQMRTELPQISRKRKKHYANTARTSRFF